MHTRIGINAPPEAVMEWLARPANARHWHAQLRHAAEDLPEIGLAADRAAGTIRWTAAPAGEMRVTPLGDASEVVLAFADTGHVEEPPVEETSPDDPATNGGNALRSIKSHVEGAGGGDPDLPMPGVVRQDEAEEAARSGDPAAG